MGSSDMGGAEDFEPDFGPILSGDVPGVGEVLRIRVDDSADSGKVIEATGRVIGMLFNMTLSTVDGLSYETMTEAQRDLLSYVAAEDYEAVVGVALDSPPPEVSVASESLQSVLAATRLTEDGFAELQSGAEQVWDALRQWCDVTLDEEDVPTMAAIRLSWEDLSESRRLLLSVRIGMVIRDFFLMPFTLFVESHFSSVLAARKALLSEMREFVSSEVPAWSDLRFKAERFIEEKENY